MKTIGIKYTTKDKSSWSANILAKDEKDAVEFLKKALGNNLDSISDLSYDKNIHAITDDVLEYIIKRLNIKFDEIVIEEEKKKKPPFKCEKCDKNFKTESALKAHITKNHT